MRRWFLATCSVAAITMGAGGAQQALGAEDALWVRYPAISPDGGTIAFCHRGDLWTVPSAGGRATRLTTHEGYETRPVWSADGSQLAFASDRHGNFDVFVMPSDGGRATRLTHHSSNDMPSDFEPDGARVLFSSSRQDAVASILPSSRIAELWSISVEGGRPKQELTTPAQWARVSAGGTHLIYEDRDGYENDWRKHHTSPVTRDIWVLDRASGAHTQITTWSGEDRNPQWAKDASGFVFLSERAGTFNVFRRSLAADSEPEQLTTHERHPVRFLTTADDGTLCYGWHGGVFVLRDGASTQVPIQVAADDRSNTEFRSKESRGATEMAVSPDEDEVAFVVRGDVFVTSVEHGTTRRITHTPQQERGLSWAPDGRTIYYASERRYGPGHPSWNLYRTSLADEAEERFFRATKFVEEAVLVGPDESFQPTVSPDGKQVAFLRNRDEIAVWDVESNDVRTLIPAERNYSYADGDISFAWSPDSKWLTASYLPDRSWLEQIGLVEVATGRVIDVTMSGYYENNPKFTPDGKALVFLSDRHGRRSHGSWGADSDVFALYLTQEAFDFARLSEEEAELQREREEEAEKKDKGKRRRKKDGDGDDAGEDAGEEGGDDDDDPDAGGESDGESDGEDGEKKEKPVPPVVVEEDGLDKRLRRITMLSAPMRDMVMSNDGEALLYSAHVDGKWDIWISKPRTRSTSKLIGMGDNGAPSLHLSKDGKTLFVRRSNGTLAKAGVGGALSSNGGGRGGRGGRGGGGPGGGGGGGANLEPIGFSAELEVDLPAERAHLFEHMWRQAREKFYNPNLHGADWEALRDEYVAMLPQIENNWDFAELMSELLGELNASHTGSGHRPQRQDPDATASLGLLYDLSWAGDGLRIGEVIKHGPAHEAGRRIAAGHILLAIGETAITADTNHNVALNRIAGKRTRLTLRDTEKNEEYEEVITPISGGAESQLLYQRLIDRRRAIVEEASGGRLGYVHVRGMNDASFRVVFRETLGRNADKEGLVVDTRFNGGGWLHDDLVVFLSGHRYVDFQPRGKERGNMGGEPIWRWAKPSIVVMSEGNYSDAHIFPWAYREHSLGKLVGTGVAGTGTAVWWETQIDRTLYFGIPQVGMVDNRGEYLENQTLEPDVEVLTDPAKIAAGTDEQLLKSVEVLLGDL